MQSERADFDPGDATWRTGGNTRVVFDSGIFSPLCEHMASSTKPEVHNILHCRRRRTEPQPPVTCTENFVKFGLVVVEICEQTYRQTDNIQSH